MTQYLSGDSSPYLSVREPIQKCDMDETTNNSLPLPVIRKNNLRYRSAVSESDANFNRTQQHLSTAIIYLQPNTFERGLSVASLSPRHLEITQSNSNPIYATLSNRQSNDIDIEKIELKQKVDNETSPENIRCFSSAIEDDEDSDTQPQTSDSCASTPPPPPRPPPPLPPIVVESPRSDEESITSRKRTLPISIFLIEIGALLVIFILSMVLVLAIREEQVNLRITMQFVYIYIYLISIIWMIWCICDILKFRRQWMKLTSTAYDQSEYMDIVEHHTQTIAYFPDIHNTGGLFMRVGAGLLCMGSLLLTVIELAITIETMRTKNSQHRQTLSFNYPKIVFIAKTITYICRFLFHCVQFSFLFRYGNIIIDRYHFLAKLGLIHIVIANLCTWFEAIVIETVEELHKNPGSVQSTTLYTTIESVELTTIPDVFTNTINFLKAVPSEESSSNETTTNALDVLAQIQSVLGVYLYPCLIEYSLISVTIFYIMWRNVGKNKNNTFIHFGNRHIFTINCSRASGGLLIGGIIVLLTIITLVPDYILDSSIAIPITHTTDFVLLIVSLFIVCISFIYTTKLYYDRQAHVDIFDQILILVTTVGDFAYTLFGLFAAIFIDIYTINMPRSVEILIGLIALFQTLLQSAFILDALKRRTLTKQEIRNKPGRELITALLLINLAIWMHDSLSAKKVRLNPLQTSYYDPSTWGIIQAFTSPLSIFYRFHSSVCLADIWQEVYHDDGNHRTNSLKNTNHN